MSEITLEEQRCGGGGRGLSGEGGGGASEPVVVTIIPVFPTVH